MSEQINLYEFEETLQDQGVELIAGVDEVGRGPIAGPVVVAAVVLPLNSRIKGLNDSKKLSEKKREELYKIIMKEALCVKVVFLNEKIVDELNIYQATKKGMIEAINGLEIKPQHVLIDAMQITELEVPNTPIIHGDARSATIAAASIVAKVQRDNFMAKMDFKYPNYGFKRHKGYCTKEHMLNLEKYGPCPIHRKTFYPVTKYLNTQIKFDL